jgi:hypothetical protein
MKKISDPGAANPNVNLGEAARTRAKRTIGDGGRTGRLSRWRSHHGFRRVCKRPFGKKDERVCDPVAIAPVRRAQPAQVDQTIDSDRRQH